MGYVTEFKGKFSFNKSVSKELKTYIGRFSRMRHVGRDVDAIKKIFPEWEKMGWKGDLGEEGEYFVYNCRKGSEWKVWKKESPSCVISNYEPMGMPGIWCQWIIGDSGCLEWDGEDNFYEYEEWLRYLIDRFFAPEGYVLNGRMRYMGENIDDWGYLIVEDNVVWVETAEEVMENTFGEFDEELYQKVLFIRKMENEMADLREDDSYRYALEEWVELFKNTCLTGRERKRIKWIQSREDFSRIQKDFSLEKIEF